MVFEIVLYGSRVREWEDLEAPPCTCLKRDAGGAGTPVGQSIERVPQKAHHSTLPAAAGDQRRVST